MPTPDRLHIDENGDKPLYDGLESEPLLDRQNKDRFLFAMAYGFRHGTAVPFQKRLGYFLTKDLHSEDIALMRAVAVATRSPEAVLDDSDVFRISEEYAHGGISLLTEAIKSTSLTSFEKRIEKELYDLLRGYSRSQKSS